MGSSPRPENNEVGSFIFSDFGLSRRLGNGENVSGFAVIVDYGARELHEDVECDWKIDVFSIALVLYRFINHRPSFAVSLCREQVIGKAIAGAWGPSLPEVTEPVRSVIK
jgi:hypothetical protein